MMKGFRTIRKQALGAFLGFALLAGTAMPAMAGSIQKENYERVDLKEISDEFKKDQMYSIDFLPWNVQELEQRVDRTDPRSVIAYFCAAYLRYTDNKEDGLAMLKALSAKGPVYDETLEPGAQSAINVFELNNFNVERNDRYWTGRILFQGGTAENGWRPSKPYTVYLNYLAENTEVSNKQYEGRDIISIHYNIIRATQPAKGQSVSANIILNRRKSNPNWYVTITNGFIHNPKGLRGNNWEGVPNDDTPASAHAGYGSASTDVTPSTDNDAGDDTPADAGDNKGNEPVAVPATNTGSFSDVAPGEWYASSVQKAARMNLINGKSATTFSPNDNLTAAEAVKLAAAMHQRNATGTVTLTNGTPWYQNYVDYAKKNNIINKDYDWDKPISRAKYIEIFSNALPDDKFKAINDIPDNSIPDVKATHPQAAAIYKLYRAGILNGTGATHACEPDANILRSAVATILVRMMYESERQHFSMN